MFSSFPNLFRMKRKRRKDLMLTRAIFQLEMLFNWSSTWAYSLEASTSVCKWGAMSLCPKFPHLYSAEILWWRDISVSPCYKSSSCQSKTNIFGQDSSLIRTLPQFNFTDRYISNNFPCFEFLFIISYAILRNLLP